MESTFIILTQIITFGTAWSMFHCVLKRKKKDWFSLVGALGYLLLPYHVYVQSILQPHAACTHQIIWKNGTSQI